MSQYRLVQGQRCFRVSHPGGLLRQGTDHAFVGAAGGTIVDLLHACVRRAQLGIFQAP